MSREKTPEAIVEILNTYIDCPFGPRVRDLEFCHPIENHRKMSNFLVRQEAAKLEGENNPDNIIRSYVNKVFGGQPANPNNPTVIKKLDATYDENAVRGTGVKATSYEDIVDRLEKALKDIKYLALVGPRGSGKTALINHWLNHRTKTFLEPSKIAWFRIDITKIYDMRRDKIDVSLERYFIVHSVYVFLQYSGLVTATESAHNSQMFEELGQILINRGADVHDAELTKSITLIREHHKKVLSKPFDRLVSESIVQSTFSTENSEIESAYIYVWKAFLSICNRDGVVILAIIDGIDNISWSKENKKYVDMCRDVSDFVSSFDSQQGLNNCKYLLASRYETIPELNLHFRPARNEGDPMRSSRHIEFSAIELFSPVARLVIQKKYSAAVESDSFSAERESCREKITLKLGDAEKANRFFERMIGYLRGYNEKFIIQLGAALQNSLKMGDEAKQCNLSISNGKVVECICRDTLWIEPIVINDYSMLRVVFDNNVRELVTCFINTSRLKGLAKESEVLGYGNINRILEYVLLGGTGIFKDSSEYKRTGRATKSGAGVFPNLLWYNEDQAQGKFSIWHGLVGVRMLQMAAFRGMSGADIMFFLEEFFDYSADVMIETLEAFIAYGLLDVKWDEQWNSFSRPIKTVNYCTEDKKYFSYRCVIRTSEKGKLSMKLLFTNIDWMYFVSLDTPLHFVKGYGEDRVRIYRNLELPKISYFNYFDAAIPTVSVLIRHMVQYHDEEMKKLKERSGRITKFKFVATSIESFEAQFQFPCWFRRVVTEGLTRMVKKRQEVSMAGKKKDVKNYLELTTMIEEIFGRVQEQEQRLG